MNQPETTADKWWWVQRGMLGILVGLLVIGNEPGWEPLVIGLWVIGNLFVLGNRDA